MRRIFTRPSVAVEADLTQLNVTAALNKELEQIKENREPTLVKKDEEKSNEDSIGNGTADASGDNGADNGGSETQANDSSDSGSTGESASDVSINADVDEGLDEEFIAEALSICEDGKKISNSYSYEAYKAFKARSNALINSINGVMGLEEIRDDYVIDSETLAQEDIASTLKAIGQNPKSAMIKISNRVELQENEIEWQFIRSSGAGGQHVNKTESAVRAVHIPSGMSVVASDQRSQWQNKKLATERLLVKLSSWTMEQAMIQAQENWVSHNHLQRGNPVKVIQESLV